MASNRAQAVPSNVKKTYSGTAKFAISQRLVQDWQDLADVCDIPAYQRAKFDRGREPAGVWEWLEQRGKLPFLPAFLTAIGRADLVEELNRHP